LKRTLSWLAALALLSCSGPGRDDPPNIVLIISDDQAWTDYGFMGHEHIRTPNLDRLARESLTFTRGHVPVSMCRPSLSTIVTGLYPHQHRIVGNDPLLPEALRDQPRHVQYRDLGYLKTRADYVAHIDRVPTLAGILADAGYLSHQSGKWWEGDFRRGGFTHGMTHGDPVRGGRHGDEGLTIGRRGLEPIFEFMLAAREESKPFFVYYAPFLPHVPHNPPRRLLDKYLDKTPHIAIARYWAMCEWLDETVGELLEFLKGNDLIENTVVVYLADNGWVNRSDGAAFAPRSKRSPYEAGVRTPILIHWPGRVEPKLDTEHLASSVDLVPTLLASAGLEQTHDMQGIDLLDPSAVASRDAIFGEIFEHDVQHPTDPLESLRFRWIITGRWKLIAPYAVREPDAAIELFDLIDDPHESRNLAEEKPDVVADLAKQLDAWWPAD
jgi:uncharacterized sulfatase